MCEVLEENMSVIEEGKVFSNYIKELRNKRNVTLEDLCEGICKHQEMLYLEQGERMLDERLQNALLERLGVGAENYEQFVDFQAYDRWEARQEILYYISYEQWNNAVELLDIYRSTYGEHNKFEHQFILSMQGQIRKCNGADSEELRELYKKAVRLTMPGIEKTPLCERALSLKELNLLLELEQYREGGERQERYLDIMKYLQKNFDHVGVAKLYPKAVYLMCKCNEKLAPKILLSYCDKALEYLRKTSRMYYMWEILELREMLLVKRINRIGKEYPQKIAELKAARSENQTWTNALRKVYDEFHVRKDTFEYCYLYVGMGMYCVNDVIRIRREMLGISREELCKDFCEIKTLVAIEERKRKP